jgi:hypothetical protein
MQPLLTIFEMQFALSMLINKALKKQVYLKF